MSATTIPATATTADSTTPTSSIASATSSSPPTPRRCVLVLGIDGCRPDCLTPEFAPNIYQLIHEKHELGYGSTAYSLKSQVGDICWSGPGWTSACTGVWRDKHGVSGNTFPTSQFDSYPAIFQRLKTFDPHAVTASCINWKPLNENILRPSDHPHTLEDNDAGVVESACRLLKHQERLDLLFVHLDDVDLAGHTYDYGPIVPEYVAAVTKADARIGLILESLRQRPTFHAKHSTEDWLIVLTTDHGGIDYTHEDGRWENRTNFIIVHGADVTSGEIFPTPLIVDVAPTILAHLGIKIASSWHLDGRPVGLKLTNRGHFMDLTVSQDPQNKYPIPPEELEEGPAAEAHIEHAPEAAAAPLISHDQSPSPPAPASASSSTSSPAPAR